MGSPLKERPEGSMLLAMALNSVSSAVSGLQAADARIQVSAHNTANLSTDGFVPLRAQAHEVPSGGVRVTISREAREANEPTDIREPSKTDLVQEVVSQQSAVMAYRANIASLKTADDISGVIISIGRRPGEK